MREHEVPTHVQAEDRVLLGLTFPQIIALMAGAGICYFIFRFVSVGTWQVKLLTIAPIALLGIGAVVCPRPEDGGYRW